jgi:Flp pilus assembly protein TadD
VRRDAHEAGNLELQLLAALAKALHQAGEHADAEREIKKALELNDDPERQDDILALLDRVRESRRLQAADEEPAEE